MVDQNQYDGAILPEPYASECQARGARRIADLRLPLGALIVKDSILARHPYLGPKGARSIVRYREIYDSTRWTPADLARERALSQENIEKLKKYIVSQ